MSFTLEIFFVYELFSLQKSVLYTVITSNNIHQPERTAGIVNISRTCNSVGALLIRFMGIDWGFESETFNYFA